MQQGLGVLQTIWTAYYDRELRQQGAFSMKIHFRALSENWADISDLAVGCFDVQIWLSGQ
jgi:hypothetical protein